MADSHGRRATIPSVDAVARSIEKTNECLADLVAELTGGDPEPRARIRHHHLDTLRDLLAAEQAEAAQLATQLPRLRNVFSEERHTKDPAGDMD